MIRVEALKNQQGVKCRVPTKSGAADFYVFPPEANAGKWKGKIHDLVDSEVEEIFEDTLKKLLTHFESFPGVAQAFDKALGGGR